MITSLCRPLVAVRPPACDGTTNDCDKTADYNRQKIQQGIDDLVLFSKLVFY